MTLIQNISVLFIIGLLAVPSFGKVHDYHPLVNEFKFF